MNLINLEQFIRSIVFLAIGFSAKLLADYLSEKNRKVEHKDKINLAMIEREDKYKLASLDKKLAVHQAAFVHWEKLRHIIYNENAPNRNSIISAANEFWINNCLYLEEYSRVAFKSILNIVSDYPMNLVNHNALEKGDPYKEELHQIILESFKTLMKFPEVLIKDIQPEKIDFKEFNSKQKPYNETDEEE